jgi:hypothetical protein
MENEELKWDKVGAFVVCTLVTVGYLGLCILMIFHPPVDNPTVQIMFGGLSAAFALAMNYFTGSTASSKQKDRLLAHYRGPFQPQFPPSNPMNNPMQPPMGPNPPYPSIDANSISNVTVNIDTPDGEGEDECETDGRR